MPPRRSHNKSRNGCLQCKQRRVKCDERGPICQNCVRRELQCSFSQSDGVGATSHETSASPAVATVPPAAFHPISESSTQSTPGAFSVYKDSRDTVTFKLNIQSDRLLELELMHHYSTSAYISCVGLRASSETVGLWQKFLPREAFKHDFLLNGILAFTALHIAKITRQPKGQIEGDKPALFSSSSSYYFQKALEYQNLAFGSFHGVLQNVTPENCHAAFGFSVLTMLFAIAIPGVEDGANQDPTSTKPDSIQSIFTLFEYLKGLASIIGISKDWLNAGPFRHVLNRHDEYTSGDWRISNTDVAQALRQLTLVNDELNNAASGADSGTTETSSSTHATNQRAISHLEFCFAKQEIPSTDPATATDEAQAAAVVGDIDRGHIIGWLGVAGSPFVARLREGDPLSLLIFAHWAILLDDLQQFWWSENSGKVLVAEIAGVLHARGPEWEERTRWARRKVGLL